MLVVNCTNRQIGACSLRGIEGRIRVAVLYGGRSSEHGVSCQSAASILAHLDPGRYDIVPVKIDKVGHWAVDGDSQFAVCGATSESVLKSIVKTMDVISDVDVVFPALHGPYGEGGALHGLLGGIGLPTVGNDGRTSAVGMDKEYTKKILAAEGIAVADGVVLRPGEDGLSLAERLRLDLPVFVKPARFDSSIGVSCVDSWDMLSDAVKIARQFDRKVLVEAVVPGREICLGILEMPDGRIRVSPSLEIVMPPRSTFFDFAAKYDNPDTVFEIPSRLGHEVAVGLREAAYRAFSALDCSGLLRVDFIVRHDGTPVVNEVNTFTGFTEASQYPRMWRADGMPYSQLLDVLIETAIRRFSIDKTESK